MWYTVIGVVKLGEHQYQELTIKGREDTWIYIKPTLERPSPIISKVNDAGIVIVSSKDSLQRLDMSNFTGTGVGLIVNIHGEDSSIEVLTQNNTSTEWRLGRPDSKSRLKLEVSSSIENIISELRKVNPEDQSAMDYSVYLNSAEGQNKADLDFLLS